MEALIEVNDYSAEYFYLSLHFIPRKYDNQLSPNVTPYNIYHKHHETNSMVSTTMCDYDQHEQELINMEITQPQASHYVTMTMTTKIQMKVLGSEAALETSSTESSIFRKLKFLI